MRGRILTMAAAAALAAGVAAPSAAAPPTESFIVVLEPGSSDVRAEAANLARQARGTVGFVYENALDGFSMTASPAAARALERNPRVAYVETDDPVSISGQTTPTGIERSFAKSNANLDIDGRDDFRVDVDVAVIDTGIDIEHPDLNVVDGINCASGNWRRASCNANYDDDHYHGTHVAGTVAALDNEIGVVGVAPGARLHAVKVLNSRGSGYTSWIVAGIDWVAAEAATIEVANMSLGGSGFNQAEYDAIQGAVAAGVAFAVAAGNDNDDAAKYSPAAFDNVLTVSALADFDGKPGGNATPTCRTDEDDTLADFSNWGPAVDIAAPGACIESTFPIEQGSYGTISGTSMASPHVAGALALLASWDSPESSADVQALYDTVTEAGNDRWTDDSGDGIPEPLLSVSDHTTFNPVLTAGPGDGAGGTEPVNKSPTASFVVQCTDLTCEFDATGSTDEDGTVTGYEWGFGGEGTATDADPATPSYTYAAGGTYQVTLTVIDNAGARSSPAQQQVTMSAGTGGEGPPTSTTLVGTSQTQGANNWRATITASGESGASTTGTWDYKSQSGGCTIDASGSCSFSIVVRANTSTVTYTDAALGSVFVSRP